MTNYIDQVTGLPPLPQDGSAPQFLLGADNHNIGNQNSSWFDPTTWGDRLENGLKFGAVSVISGAAQLYTSGEAIGNWAGIGDGTETKIQNIVSGIDSDLGQYYSQNKEGADLVGFIASSFLPGLAGIKVLNAGQHALEGALKTGTIGRNIAEATGLLVPKTATYISAAAHDINAASATFSAISQNGIKALMSGARQQVLEGMAFETMVQATMFTSPILDQQSSGDIAKNIMMGGVLGGVIGGTFEGVSTFGKIMSKVKIFEADTKYAASRALQQELSSPSINVIRNAQDLEAAALPMKPGIGATADEISLYNVQLKQTEQRAVRASNDLRANMNELAKGSDLTATNMLTDALKGQSSQTVMEGVLHADEIVRPGVMTQVEKEINALAKAGKPADLGHQVGYVKLTGEGSGAVTAGEPVMLGLADTVGVSKGGSLMDGVLSKVKDYKFKVGGLWDATSKAGKTSHNEAEARYLWASRLEKLPDELHVHMNDLPLLEKARELGKLDVQLVDNTGAVVQKGFTSRTELTNYLVKTKESVADSLMNVTATSAGTPNWMGAEEISKIVNTKLSRLSGTAGEVEKDYFAYQAARDDYQVWKSSKNLPVDAVADDPRFLPSYAKISRRVPDMTGANGHVLDGAAWIKSQEKLAQDAVDRVLAKATGPMYANIPTITESQAWSANRGGAGAKLAAFASGSYGALESIVQAYGGATQKLKTAFRQTTSDTMQGPLAALGRNQEAAIEFSTVNQKVTRSAKQWVRHSDTQGERLITKELDNALKKQADEGGELTLEELSKGDDIIKMENHETYQAVDAMMARSGARQETYGELRAAQGKTDAKDPSTYRPVRANPKDYPHFAFVKDDSVTGQGHTTMIFADSPAKLQQLATKAEQSGYRVHFKQETEEFRKAYGDYEYSRTLNESYIDSELKNKGIYSEFYTKTDPQKIIDDIIQQHLREDDVLAMELMRAKNQKVFDYLEDQGKAYSRVESSKFGGSIARAEQTDKNPYLSYIKTALDISKAPENHLLHSFNKFLDESVSKAVGAVRDVWKSARTPYDAEHINTLLDKYGMNTGYRTAADELLVNHTAPKGELTKFVRAANGMMATLVLGLDPLNSLVNAIGANVLRGTELTQITRAIKDGDTKLAGKLAALAKIDITGKGDMIMSPAKLYAQAQKNFFEDARLAAAGKPGPTMQRYLDAGYVSADANAFHNMMDDFTLRGTETVPDLNSRLHRGFEKAKALGETGRKLTGNKFAEDYNRFISADVMRQITDLAESHGLLNRAEAHSYINTFVNRVDGNIVASQRPLMFQGPLGNAIGLFQSYQFNMMQNLFRYTAEGKAKDTAMLLGLQGTFFGLNGLPGFHAINNYVVGTASGNTNHTDLYDATYGAAGKQMGDLLMYGIPSDLLRTNLYSRGDINPRSLTIIPNQIQDIPFVSGFSKMVLNIKEMTNKMADGGNVWESFRQGLEHNGLSRPLAGMAQVMGAAGPSGKAYSTASGGSILFSNDLVSLASLSRMAGGRPLDEAVVNDGMFRIHSYQQGDSAKMRQLAETVKSSSIQGLIPSQEQMAQFAAEYAKTGGKQQNFNKWVLKEMTNANVSQADAMTLQLQNPFAKKVQVLMGGDPYAE
jgi:hypothetical protein